MSFVIIINVDDNIILNLGENHMKSVLALFAVLAILAIVGTMDYQDELAEEQRYVTFVCDGTWPDYKNLKPECE